MTARTHSSVIALGAGSPWSLGAGGRTGVLVTLGCLLALYLGSIRIGTPRDTDMDPGYAPLLIAGVLAGTVVPAGVRSAVLRTPHLIIAGMAAAATAVTVTAYVTTTLLGVTGP